MAVAGYDGMAAIFAAIKQQNGRLDADKTMEILKTFKSTTSPRGPFEIDPETRDIVQTIYIRRLERRNGQLANIEFDTMGMVKDWWKIMNKK